MNKAALLRLSQFLAAETEEDSHMSMEQSVVLVLLLGSGQGDALSGRFLSIEDDVKALIHRSAEIDQADLYTLHLHKLATNREPR